MDRQRKKSKIYRTEILWISKWRHEESKVNYTKLKYCRWEYADTRGKKSKIKGTKIL